MTRGWLVVGVVLLVATTSAGALADSARSDGFADVLVGDVVIGESEQRFHGIRLVEFPEDTEAVRLDLDLGVLATHGIDVSDAEVELSDGAVRGATIEAATVRDGRLRLVFAPDDADEDAIIAVEAFRLTGLDTTDAEAARGLTYDANFSAGDARVRSFDIVDPDRVTPTLETNPLYTDASTHRVSLRDVQAAGGDVTIELDVGVLQDHGIDLGSLEAEVTAADADVVSTSVDRGKVTAVVAPAPEAVLFDVRIDLRGLDSASVDTEQRLVASDVVYAVSVAGAAGDEMTVEPFDIATHPTVHSDPGTTRSASSQGPTSITGDGFGFAVTVAAVALLVLLARRRE
jgi:hypothetical protein